MLGKFLLIIGTLFIISAVGLADVGLFVPAYVVGITGICLSGLVLYATERGAR